MKPARTFQSFSWKGAHLRICSQKSSDIFEELKRERILLEKYLLRHPDFATSLIPTSILANAPESAKRMQAAASLVGVGPMAAVAGTMAQLAAEFAEQQGCKEAIVENGGDIFIISPKPLTVGIFAGNSPLSGKLAFQIKAAELPLALCSSSATMGHSLSFGNCDLATVVAKKCSLADAAATYACNQVKSIDDINSTLEKVMAIKGIQGILLIKDDKIGMMGELPKIVKNADFSLTTKVSHDKNSDFKPIN